MAESMPAELADSHHPSELLRHLPPPTAVTLEPLPPAPKAPKRKKRPKPDLEPKALPPEYRELLANKGVDLDESNLKLIFIRCLYKTDISEHHMRLSMPCRQVKEEFLTPENEAELRSRKEIKVVVIEPSKEEQKMHLARWNIGNSWCYALTHCWKTLVKRNRLRDGDVIQVWSFRFEGNQLGFLIHKVAPGPIVNGGDESNGSASSRDRVVRSDGSSSSGEHVARTDVSSSSGDRVARSDGSGSSGEHVARTDVSSSSGDRVARSDGSGSSGNDGYGIKRWGSKKRRGWTGFDGIIFFKHQRV